MLVLVVGIAQAKAFMLHLASPATAKRQIGRIATYPLLATRCFDQCGPSIATKAAMLTGNQLGFHAVVGHRLPSFGDGARSVLIGSSPCLRPDLSFSAVSHYALSTVVFISKTVRHALNQLDLVVNTSDSFYKPFAFNGL